MVRYAMRSDSRRRCTRPSSGVLLQFVAVVVDVIEHGGEIIAVLAAVAKLLPDADDHRAANADPGAPAAAVHALEQRRKHTGTDAYVRVAVGTGRAQRNDLAAGAVEVVDAEPNLAGD